MINSVLIVYLNKCLKNLFWRILLKIFCGKNGKKVTKLEKMEKLEKKENFLKQRKTEYIYLHHNS